MFGATSILGKAIDSQFFIITGICVALFSIIIFLMLYFSFKYTRKKNPNPTDIEGHAPLELTFLGLSIAIVLLMFYLGWGDYKTIREEIPKDALAVKATGQMWVWSFEYPNGKLSNTLNVPVNKPVRMNIESRDVLHSFFVPAFRVKQDAVPGSVKSVWFTADKEGTYDLFCAEYCGTNHSAMLSKAVVMSEDKFNGWLEGKAEAQAAPPPPGAPTAKGDAKKGAELYSSKGCVACHSTDGSKRIGPSFKGIYGTKVKVTTDGKQREITIDDEYIRSSELTPNADVVVGYQPIMPPQKGILSDGEINSLIEYIKSLK
ncbi:MAG: cytochrome c oxidase subunit II [Deltaproteobacteria bacterium]|nr:cytochrome c oxidase subunit II [Deltaproteobacteria bacterium]